jgi:hypothetical protein
LFGYLGERDRISALFGDEPETVLPVFWERFEALEPGNSVFDAFRSGVLRRDRSIPMLLHGDEGRTRKRQAMMVFNCHGLIGKGCKPFAETHSQAPRVRQLKTGVNIAGHSMSTRFLLFVLARANYGPSSAYLYKMIDEVVEEFVKLQTDGILIGSERWNIIILGAVGDLMFFSKVGKFTRSFAHVAKRSNQGVLNGLCHCCLAGKPAWPWESFTDNPSWVASIAQEDPWESPPSMVAKLHCNPLDRPSFFKFDIWHCYHLGAGRLFLASCVSEFLPFLPGRLLRKL